MKQKTGISFFQKYLTVWVLLCMAAGIVIGHFIPVVPEALGRMEIAGISIPIAILIWIMIYPMECEGSREKSQGTFSDLDCQLGDQAVYDVWFCFAFSLWGV